MIYILILILFLFFKKRFFNVQNLSDFVHFTWGARSWVSSQSPLVSSQHWEIGWPFAVFFMSSWTQQSGHE